MLNKKLWYLKDQEPAGTKEQAATRARPMAAMTGRKDHPRHGEILKRVLTDLIKNNQILAANGPAAGGLHPQAAASLIRDGRHQATTNLHVKVIRDRQRVKRVKNDRILRNAANRIQAGLLIQKAGPSEKAIRARQMAKHVKNDLILQHAASLTQADLLIQKAGLNVKAIRALKMVKSVKGAHILHKEANLIQAGQLTGKINPKGNSSPITVTGKVANVNSAPIARAVHVPHLATGNLPESAQIILKINHIVLKDHQTGKLTPIAKRLQKPCAAARKRNLKTTA